MWLCSISVSAAYPVGYGVHIFAVKLAILTKVYHNFSRAFHLNAVLVPYNWAYFSLSSFPVHDCPIIQCYSNSLTVSKQQKQCVEPFLMFMVKESIEWYDASMAVVLICLFRES
jgi:hypothetical protein